MALDYTVIGISLVVFIFYLISIFCCLIQEKDLKEAQELP